MAMYIKPDTSFAGLYAETGSVGTPFISRYQWNYIIGDDYLIANIIRS